MWQRPGAVVGEETRGFGGVENSAEVPRSMRVASRQVDAGSRERSYRPRMSQDVRGLGHRDIAVRPRGGGQPCMVNSAVSEPEATAFNLPRVPEYRWRIPLAGPPVRVRFGQRLAPISSSAGMRGLRGRLSATVSSTRHRHAYGPVHEDFTTELERMSRTIGGGGVVPAARIARPDIPPPDNGGAHANRISDRPGAVHSSGRKTWKSAPRSLFGTSRRRRRAKTVPGRTGESGLAR